MEMKLKKVKIVSASFFQYCLLIEASEERKNNSMENFGYKNVKRAFNKVT